MKMSAESILLLLVQMGTICLCVMNDVFIIPAFINIAAFTVLYLHDKKNNKLTLEA